MASAEQDAWIRRVLGVEAAVPGTAKIGAALTSWREATEMVDAQMARLQSALRQSDDEELREIGELGLNAVTGNFRVPLMAAASGAERGAEGDIAKLAALIPRFKAHLQSDERVEACDENPFGVAVGIRSTLLPALDTLAAALPAS